MDTNRYPLSIRFVGPGLQTQGVPICDLGESLIALQRMVHKAYLIDTERLFVHAVLSQEKRRKLALQIADRDRHSDMYLLNWLMQEVLNPLPATLLSDLLLTIAGAASIYLAEKVKEKLKKMKLQDAKTEDQKIDLLAVRMYNEVQELANHVNPEGGIDSLEIHISGCPEPIVINQAVKEYVKKIEGAKVYGERETILGKVNKAHTLERDCIEVLDYVDGKWIKVYIPGNLFESLLKDLTDPRQEKFDFTGRAIFRVGRALHSFSEFQAEAYAPA